MESSLPFFCYASGLVACLSQPTSTKHSECISMTMFVHTALLFSPPCTHSNWAYPKCVSMTYNVQHHLQPWYLKWVVFQLQPLENRGQQGFDWLQSIEEAPLEIGILLCQGSDILDTFIGLDLHFIFFSHRGSISWGQRSVNPDSGHSSHIQLDFSLEW